MTAGVLLGAMVFFGGAFLAFLPFLFLGWFIISHSNKGHYFYKRYKKLGVVFIFQALFLLMPVIELRLLDADAGVSVPHISLALILFLFLSSLWVIKNIFPKLKKEENNKRFYKLALSLQFLVAFYALLVWFYFLPLIFAGAFADTDTVFYMLLPYMLAILLSFLYASYSGLKWFVEGERGLLSLLVLFSFVPLYALIVWTLFS